MNVTSRRNALLALALGAPSIGEAASAFGARASTSPGINVRTDHGAIGDGTVDDTSALQAAIIAGSTRQVPVWVPPGVYATSRPLAIPPNTQLRGSAGSGSFGCRLEPYGCAAFQLGHDGASFHSLLEDLLIWPRGPAPVAIIEIGNSYSCVFRNIRIHNAQSGVRAAVLLHGADERSEPCHSITWDNLIVRSDTDQPAIGVLAAARCGTHRFYGLDLENCQTLLEWQGGQLDLITPYLERAGRYGLHCDVIEADPQSSLNTFGGTASAADSAVALGVHRGAGAFGSYGTVWGLQSAVAAHFYAIPSGPFALYGVRPNLSGRGTARYGGINGWERAVEFPDAVTKARIPVSMRLDAQGQRSLTVALPGVIATLSTIQVRLSGNTQGVIASAHACADGEVMLGFFNPTSSAMELRSLVATLESRIA